MMKRGDLILYKSTGAWYDPLIVAATHGPYVHVTIVFDEGIALAATDEGITYDHLPPEDLLHTVISLSPTLNTAAGLAWAVQQVGKKYGWMDIVYQAFKYLNPNNPLQFGAKDHWDCSDFVTRYLQHCGYDLPDMFSDPYTMTPNDLGRMFGLLSPRKGAVKCN